MSLKYAELYVRHGLAVVPVPPKSKRPVLDGWQNLRLTTEQLPAHFSNGANVGILCGEPSGNLVDVDCDILEALAAAAEYLPPTGLVHGRPGNPTSHYWYETPGVKTTKFRFIEGDAKEPTMYMELRSTGCQTVVPPSIHPGGEEYRWECGKAAATVEAKHLTRDVALAATCTLLARHWPGRGSRDDAALALAGMLLRAGWSVEETDRFTRTVARSASDEEWDKRAKGEQTHRKLNENAAAVRQGRTAPHQVTGAPKLAELLRDGKRVVSKAREWLGLPYEINEKDEESHRTERPQADENSSNSFNSYAIETYPERLAKAGWYGLAGEIVRAIEPHTEADPHALLFQLLAAFGNAAGRHAHVMAEADRHYTNLFLCLVGPTAGGRKGTSWGHARGIVQKVDPDWVAERVVGGLSSGEGLIHTLRDDEAITDRRLLAYQPEFAAVLKVLMREGNQLADILKQAWDGQPLQVVTKQQPERASDALVSVIGHITKDELLRYLTETEAASGFGNRFLWVCVKRAQYLPEGGDLSKVNLAPLVERLRAALTFARTAGGTARDDAARGVWRDRYRELSEGRPGLLGAMTARAEAQVMRLALIEALLDQSQVIGERHLEAGLALWNYALASARYVFGAKLGDPTADAILVALRGKPDGMTRTEISSLFARNKSAGELARALGKLQELGLVRCEREHTEGREAERWHAVTKETNDTKDAERRPVNCDNPAHREFWHEIDGQYLCLSLMHEKAG
jgi:hypothetical protein